MLRCVSGILADDWILIQVFKDLELGTISDFSFCHHEIFPKEKNYKLIKSLSFVTNMFISQVNNRSAYLDKFKLKEDSRTLRIFPGLGKLRVIVS